MHDVVIIGAGASGTALLYTLASYTDIKKVAIMEKYDRPGQVNSKASNNSQTLHVGDIETNYTIDKVKQVYPSAMMVAQYAKSLPENERNKILFNTPKMVLGVGKDQVLTLEKRYKDLLPIFPKLKKLYREDIAKIEPEVIRGRNKNEPVIALYNIDGYAVDFENLSQSFIDHAKINKSDIEIFYKTKVHKIEKNTDNLYEIKTTKGEIIKTKVVIVDADSYSLMFAKQMGYGENFSLIPIAGSFYFTKKLLNGKVYTVQEPKLPFAAVHGDPDVRVPNQTRWGPTARFNPVLESSNFKTSGDFLRSSGLHRLRTWKSFIKILLDPTRFSYLVKNMLYELPWVGNHLFLVNVKKIIPTIKSRDIRVAKGYGGMRLQRVDTNTHELQLGEGKILGDNIIFNMTPSPGASVSLYNALRDTEQIMKFFNGQYKFDLLRMEKDLVINDNFDTHIEPSIPSGYAS